MVLVLWCSEKCLLLTDSGGFTETRVGMIFDPLAHLDVRIKKKGDICEKLRCCQTPRLNEILTKQN